MTAPWHARSFVPHPHTRTPPHTLHKTHNLPSPPPPSPPQESELRPEVVSLVRRELGLREAAVKLWEDDRPWLSEEERKGVATKVGGLGCWRGGGGAVEW